MEFYKQIGAMALLSIVSIFGNGNDSCCNSCGSSCCDTCQSCDTCGTPCCESQPCNTCDPCNSCCCSPCCCEPCDFVPPCPPETCAYNAPEIIDIKCGCDFFVTASFVYFQAKEENLEWMELNFTDVVTDFTVTPPVITQTVQNEYSEMCFDYEPAFKVGLGFNFGCDNWTFYAEYFRYHADVGSGCLSGTGLAPQGNGGLEEGNGATSPTMTLNGSLYLLPESFGLVSTQEEGTFGAQQFFSALSLSGKTKWRLEIDTADFLLGRRYYVGKCLVFEPYVGLRAAWIDQTYWVDYCATTPGFTAEEFIQESSVKLTSCSWGVGAKMGLHTDWKFCGGFYLFGDSSFDILYTDYEMKEYKETTITDEINGTAVGVDEFIVDGKKNDCFCFLRPHLQVGLGLGWGDYFCCNDWYFDLQIGYEFHVYWNQNVLPMIPDQNQDPSRLYGDLDLHGLVITARLDF